MGLGLAFEIKVGAGIRIGDRELIIGMKILLTLGIFVLGTVNGDLDWALGFGIGDGI